MAMLLLFVFSIIFAAASSSSSSVCPIDLSYVETFPWDASSCRLPNDGHCCQTLLSLLGMGLAQHLKDTSLFQLSDADSSSSCLSTFQTKLASMAIQPSAVSQCFENSTQFVANSSSCAGILTTHDWIAKIGPASQVDASCRGDLTGLTRCGACADAGMKVTSQLVGLDPNATKCFYFTILYAAGIVNEFGPKDIRVVSCILGLPLSSSAAGNRTTHVSRKALLALSFTFTSVLLLFLLAFALYRKRAEKSKQNAALQEDLPNFGAKWFHITELERATNGFSQRNLIGQGAYGVVYKGILSDGTLVAVKQILDSDSERDEDFTNEVEIISKIRHRNLLSLRGCCVTNDSNFKGQKRRFLVYDFMSNGNLSDHLFCRSKSRKPLTWPQRKGIILDIAKGLAYLHYGIKPAIYHRDIKATNILLDSDTRARVADFGLAKQSREGQSHLTTRVAGTHGYLAPEYALYGQLTEKSDVYSFGILVLEMMSGRRVLDTSSSSVVLITDWAWMLVKSGDVEAVFDEAIREEGAKGVMERFVQVGMLCGHVMVSFRPTMAEAVKMLEGDIDIPRLPDRPLPLGHESFKISLQFSSSSER